MSEGIGVRLVALATLALLPSLPTYVRHGARKELE